MVMHFIEPSSGEYKDRNAPFPIYGSSIPESVKEMLLRQREHERELYETAMAANNGDGTNSNASKNDGSSSRTKSKGVQYTRQQMAENLLWIHVKEPSLLHDLAKEVGMHELCMAGFLDIRAFSSFIPVPHALFVSFCSFLMDGEYIFLVTRLFHSLISMQKTGLTLIIASSVAIIIIIVIEIIIS